MRRLQQRRSVARFLCFLMILEMFVASPNVAEASTSKVISKNGREYCAVDYDVTSVTVTLASPNKPENTKVVSDSVPSWVKKVNKPNYNSPVFKITLQENTTNNSRAENIKFTDGTNTWTLTLTQYGKPSTTPTTKPPTKGTTKGATPTPKKTTTSPTKAPTSIPTSTPTPEPAETLPVNRNKLQFSAQGGQDTLSLEGTGYSLTFSFPDNPSVPGDWVGMIYDGNQIKVKVEKNKDYAPRSMKVKITDNNTKQYAYVTINQSAAPTPTPTPAPAETLPINRNKMQFGAQGGQDTLSLTGTGYNLTFSFPDNPSAPTGWVGMFYDGNQIKVKVERNKDHAPRSVKIKISDSKTNQYAYVTINQSAAPTPTPTPYLTADRVSFPYDSKGGNDTIRLKGLQGSPVFEYNRETGTKSGWAKVSADKETVSLSVDENNTIFPRNATVRITDGKTKQYVIITITQEAMPNSAPIYLPVRVYGFKVYASSLIYGNEADSEVIDVSGNSGRLSFSYKWEQGEQSGWARMEYIKGQIKLDVDANMSYETRSVIVTITDDGSGKTAQVYIKQEGITAPELVLNTHKLELPVGGGTGTVTIVSGNSAGNIDFEYSEGKQPGWLGIINYGQIITVKVNKNTSYVPRSVSVTVINRKTKKKDHFTIVQDAAPTPTPQPMNPTPEPSPNIRVFFFDIRTSYNKEPEEKCTEIGQFYGKKYNLPEEPVRPGYNFLGWYTEQYGGYEVTKDSIVDDKDEHNLFAHWVSKKPSRVDCIRNYKGFYDSVVGTLDLYEGNRYNTIPALNDRPGFEFAGWYTSRYNGKSIKADTIYEGEPKIYAQWKVKVRLQDFSRMNIYSYTIDSREGCLVSIPENYTNELARYGFKVAGWAQNPSANRPDNGDAKNYQLPKEMEQSVVDLYAVNESGETFSEYLNNNPSARTIYLQNITSQYLVDAGKQFGQDVKDSSWDLYEKWRRKNRFWLSLGVLDGEGAVTNGILNLANNTPKGLEGIVTDGILGPPYNPDKNYEANKEYIENSMKNSSEFDSYLNGQHTTNMSNIKLGESNLSDSGCGVIACYNALYSCGIRNVSLADMINLVERRGYLWGIPKEVVQTGVNSGFPGLADYCRNIQTNNADNLTGFGVNPFNIDEILGTYGVSTTEFASRGGLISAVKNGIKRGVKRRFIVCYFYIDKYSSSSAICSAHFIYLETTDKENPIMVCNMQCNEKAPRDITLNRLESELTGPKGVDLFFMAYEVKP